MGDNLLAVLIHLLGLSVYVTHAQDEMYFSQTPKDVDVIQGKSATLHCEVTPNNGIRYHWELNDSKIANTTRRYQEGQNLHFTRVDKEKDVGKFSCVAQDLNGLSMSSSPASLNIQWIGEASVQLQSPESSSFITSGSEIILRCHLDATGDVHVEWFRNADRLVKTPHIEIKKKKLHLKSATPADNGVYRCIARNEAGIQQSVKNFALALAGNQTALIKVVPSNQIIKRGNTAFFDCSYENADGLEWYFKDIGPLETNTRISLLPNGSLQINNIQDSDQGMYNCVGIKGDSTEVPQSYVAELKISYISNLTSASFEPALPDETSVLIRPKESNFQLTCLEPTSMPEAKRYWINGLGHTISDTGDIKVDDDGRLIVQQLKQEHSGNYSCIAENIAGRTDKTIELIVTSKPIIKTNPSSAVIDEGRKVTLSCNYDINKESEPYTILKWYKDGKVIKHDEEGANLAFQRLHIYKTNGSLIINSVKPLDRGDYVCEILTTGFDPIFSKVATITVIETLKFSPPPVNKKLELRSIAKVHCKAQGTPPPTIRWEKYQLEGESFPGHITDMNGTLHFNGVLSEDQGKYTCIASNSQGVINVTLSIDVVVAPKFTVLAKNPTEVLEGSSVMLDCVAEGDPKPTIHWDKNLKMNDFNRSRFHVLDNGTLFIQEVYREDENNYGCTAGSSAGLNRKEIHLIVHTKEGYHPGEGEGNSTVTKAVLITMSVAAAYIILVVGLMIWCRYRRRSRKLPMAEGTKTENGDLDHTELKEEANGTAPGSSQVIKEIVKQAHKDGQKSDGTETAQSHSSNQSKKSKSSYDKISIARSNLKEIKLIGRGEFGEIMVAKLPKSAVPDKNEKRNSSSSIPEEKELIIMVKSLVLNRDEAALTEFKREIDIFSKLSHENIVRLWGLCREAEPHYMILEYTDWGDLKQFLTATRKGTSPSLTIAQCLALVHQIAKGMEHLAAARFVHKDLAARNCLVTSSLKAKVALPRLTKEPYSQEYCKHINQIIPLRWMPYEAVYEDEYSTKSDVYSYGVLISEIFSQGELPFPKMNDNSFLAKLNEKTLDWKPHKNTPDELQKLQESCWDISPQNRPSFENLVKETEIILKSV